MGTAPSERGKPAGAERIEDPKDGKSWLGTDPISFLSWRCILALFDEEIWAGPARLQEMPKLVDLPDDLFLREDLGFQGFWAGAFSGAGGQGSRP